MENGNRNTLRVMTSNLNTGNKVNMAIMALRIKYFPFYEFIAMIAARIRICCDKFHNKSEIVLDCYNLFKSINSANLVYKIKITSPL